MCLTACQTLGRERTEVLDVVRHYGAEFAACDLKNCSIAAANEVWAVRDRINVVAALAQQPSDLRR